MNIKYSLKSLLVGTLSLGFSIATGTATEDQPRSIDIAFITHLDANMPEQDVFIERIPGSGEVFRVTPGDHNMRAPVRSKDIGNSLPNDTGDAPIIGYALERVGYDPIT